jgi:DNA-binding winged helix-turn-helix (wHTH) protein
VRLPFADCVLDTDLRELRRAGEVRPLTPKAFHLLEILVERRPAAVTHDALRKALWPDAVAGGTTLARLVAEVREAVGDEASAPRVVRTVQRFGYAFCGSVTDNAESSASELPGPALGWGPLLIPLAYGANLIGRAPGALISVASTDVSRRHAQIVVTGEGASLEDLGSRHGTSVAGKPIDGRVNLKDRDEIVVGSVTLIFHASITDERTSG